MPNIRFAPIYKSTDRLKRSKGVVVKLLPGNKLEVPSVTRSTPVLASNAFELLSNAVTSFVLMQGM